MSFRHNTIEVQVILDKVELLEKAELLPEAQRANNMRYLIDDIRALARDIANDSTENGS